MERAWKLLDLPKEHCFPLIAVVIGYPTEEPDYLKGRLDGVGVVHRDHYHNPKPKVLEEITRRYDDKTTHLALTDNLEQQGHQHYLDWLFKVRLQRNAKPAEQETPMLHVLKQCGSTEA